MKILIVLPIYNEEKIIRQNALAVLKYCGRTLANDEFLIVLADNKSTDQTAQICREAADSNPKFACLRTEQKGKGRAILSAWQKYLDYDIFIFMDADLATDLEALPELIKNIKAGNNIVIGSRYLAESRVNRSFFRHFVSSGYRMMIRILLGIKTNDLACGFKAVDKKVIFNILPLVRNLTWFFDSELVILAARKGYAIKEIPVKYSEKRGKGNKSKVNLIKVSLEYLKEIIKLRKRL